MADERRNELIPYMSYVGSSGDCAMLCGALRVRETDTVTVVDRMITLLSIGLTLQFMREATRSVWKLHADVKGATWS